MRIFDIFKGVLKRDFTEKTYDFSTYRNDTAENYVAIEAHALFTVIELISSLLSKCEVKVYVKGEEYKKDLYDIFNVQPNRNQNAVEWKKEIFTKLLYCKQVLVVQKNKDQFLIADGYNLEERVLQDYIFTEVTRQDYTFNNAFSMKNVLFMQYGNAQADAFLSNVLDFYTKLMDTAAAKYHRGRFEKGILKVSARAAGSPDYEETFKELMSDYFKEYFGKGNAVLPLFEGYEYQAGTAESTKKYSNEITDVTTIFQDALTRAAQAYKVPVSLVRGDVAGIKDAYNIMLTNCIDPLAEQFSAELTSKLFSREERISGSCIVVDTTNVKHNDLFDIASGADKLIASGAASIDEVRHHAGLRELDEDWSTKHYITKNYATVDMVEGGETDGNNSNEIQSGADSSVSGESGTEES